MNSVAELIDLLELGQKADYDREAVTQLDHALQCAALAENAGKSAELITACLLHDIGHLLYHLKKAKPDLETDDHHEVSGAKFLQNSFAPAVTEPIRLHVPAKRYLCFADPLYWDSLSPVSKKTLELQGGIFTEEQAEAFINEPFAKEAVQLRIWDDQAKVAGLITPDLAHFVSYVEKSLVSQHGGYLYPTEEHGVL